MSSTRWDQRFFASTRGRIVSLLRRTSRTVEELAGALDLTDNAVRAHLAALERDGLVEQRGVRRGVGKPAYSYDLTPEAERLFPKAYSLVLRELLTTLADDLGPAETEAVLRATGHRLAAGQHAPHADLHTRCEGAVALLNGWGGLAEAELAEDGAGYVIRGYSCPLASVVAGRPETCHLVEALLTAYLGTPAHEQCTHGESPRCCFAVPQA
jgi:predicted ArsR family transcriptional regulator